MLRIDIVFLPSAFLRRERRPNRKEIVPAIFAYCRIGPVTAVSEAIPTALFRAIRSRRNRKTGARTRRAGTFIMDALINPQIGSGGVTPSICLRDGDHGGTDVHSETVPAVSPRQSPLLIPAFRAFAPERGTRRGPVFSLPSRYTFSRLGGGPFPVSNAVPPGSRYRSLPFPFPLRPSTRPLTTGSSSRRPGPPPVVSSR